MSKRRDIVKRIADEAKRQNVGFVLEREGANHTVYNLGGLMIPIPRHREVGEGLTEQIYRRMPAEAGEGLVEAMSHFTAHVTRDGRFWLIHVPEIDRHTQARHLREIDTMARDLVAVMTGQDPAGIQLTVDIHTPDVAAAHLARAAELREESQRAQAAAAAELRKAARELKNAGMPLRDIGQLLDVSYQRAHQLVS